MSARCFSRTTRTAGQLRQLVARASQLQGQARATRTARTWAEALVVSRQAVDIAGGAEVAEELRQQAQELHSDMTAEAREVERDEQMLATLEDIRIRRAEVRHEGFDFASVLPGYAAAFRNYGLNIDTLKPEVTGAAIRQRAIRTTLVTALDEWAWGEQQVKPTSPVWQRLAAVARAADPDPWRNPLRDALLQEDVQALKTLAAHADIAGLPAATLELLGHTLGLAGAVREAADLLTRAQRRYPGDFWINQHLAYFLAHQQPRKLDDAIRFYTVAIALRSDNPGVYLNYGAALQLKGLHEEAGFAYGRAVALKSDYVAARKALGSIQLKQRDWATARQTFTEVIRRQPADATVHAQLAFARYNLGELDQALESIDKAIRLTPSFSQAHNLRGGILLRQKRLDDALAAYQKAALLEPKAAEVHANLAGVYKMKGRWDEALASYREAIRHQPEEAANHFELAVLLTDRQQNHQGAATAFKEAIRLRPDHAEAHINLGHALRKQGLFVEALAATRHGHAIGSKRPEWTVSSERWVRELEQLVELDAKLAAVSQGKLTLTTSEERLELARFCANKGSYATAAQFCAQAFGAKPELANNLYVNNRYNAACMAVKAAAGLGADTAMLDKGKRDAWRQQGLEWLRADLKLMAKELEHQPEKARAFLRVALPYWQAEEALTSVRDEAALAALPEAERAAWRTLWAEVAGLRKKIEKSK